MYVCMLEQSFNTYSLMDLHLPWTFFVCDLRYEECKTKLTPFLKKVGFNPKTGMNCVCILRYVHKLHDYDQRMYSVSIVQVSCKHIFNSGYSPSDINFIPVSGLTGANLKALASDVCTWYK